MVRFHWWRFVFLAMAVGGFAATSRGADPPERQIAAHLAAGEFGPALTLAGTLPKGPARDRALAQIALAQAQSGASYGATGTLASMADDRLRSDAVAQMRSQGRNFGGGPQPNFEALINLITNTVAPQSWKDGGGTGEGTIEEFPTGVYVDARGLLAQRAAAEMEAAALARAKREAWTAAVNASDVNRASRLRKVSLTRLEREVQLRYALGQTPDEAMQNLAGLTRIEYVFVYPETGDIVLAGPAGGWKSNGEGRPVNAKSGIPVVQLDDLVVVLRNAQTELARFGCAIRPREANLAKTKLFLTESTKTPLKPGGREKWVSGIRDALGRQDIEVYGIDPRTHAAHILVEADYHMKRIGMGLEPGTINVKSYLDTVTIGPDGKLPPMDVLRWWFTLNYDAVTTTEARDAFALKGPGVKVLSENELLTARGERVHTGKSDELNSRFAASFTKDFELLAAKYPVYAELRNIFDLALVAALIKNEDIFAQAQWHQTHFGPKGAYQPALSRAPTEVDTIMNYRVVEKKHIVAGVSGGVRVDPQSLVAKDAIEVDTYGGLKAERLSGEAKKTVDSRRWWWD